MSESANRYPTPMPGMLTPAQVARLTNLSRATVYRAIERGELRASRLCGRLRVDLEELEAWKARSAVRAHQADPQATLYGRANAGSSTFLDELKELGGKRA